MEIIGKLGNSQGEGFNGYAFLTILLLLLLYIVVGALLEHNHVQWIHETGLGIIVGFVVGGFLRYTDQSFYEANFKFNNSFFFQVVLPPIIFSGGYNLKKRRFFQNFYYISLYGVIGTIINFAVMASILLPASQAQWVINGNTGNPIELSGPIVFIFSATICATDSVAALTMIQSDKYPQLFSAIFGEGMVNDAVAIILFQTVGQYFPITKDQIDFTWDIPFKILLGFIVTAIVSILIGFVFALMCTILIRKCRFLTHSATIETSITFIFGYLSYIVCQELGYSGVISILVSGIIMAHYNLYNLSDIGSASTGITFQTLALFTEAYLFLFLGLSSWNIFSSDAVWSWSFFLLALSTCIFARFCGVFVLSWIAMTCKGRKNWRFNRYEMGIIWFSGIIRGAIAFALITKISSQGSQDPQLQQQVDIVISTTLFIVILTTIVLGGLMPTYITVSINQIQQNTKKYNELHPSVRDSLVVQRHNEKGEDENDKKYKSQSQKFWKTFDEVWIKPKLIYDYENRKELIKARKMKVKGAIVDEELKTSYIGNFQKVEIEGYLAPVFEEQNQRLSYKDGNISLSKLDQQDKVVKKLQSDGEDDSMRS